MQPEGNCWLRLYLPSCNPGACQLKKPHVPCHLKTPQKPKCPKISPKSTFEWAKPYTTEKNHMCKNQRQSLFPGFSPFSMIFGKIIKLHDFSMTGKTVVIFPGFPAALGTLLSVFLPHHCGPVLEPSPSEGEVKPATQTKHTHTHTHTNKTRS